MNEIKIKSFGTTAIYLNMDQRKQQTAIRHTKRKGVRLLVDYHQWCNELSDKLMTMIHAIHDYLHENDYSGLHRKGWP